MSHALLLRLFLSPNFFSVHVALQYLRLYADNIGITFYLTRRLKELDTGELRDVWGFICHLLVTRPSKSRALECFVSDIAHRSTHIAMITLWFMQAALKDLSLTRHDSQSFLLCQRTLLMCHEIVFGDLPPPARTPYSTMSLPFKSRFAKRTIRTQVEPALVGLGILLAGVPGLPKLTEVMGEVAVEQGRIDEEGQGSKITDTVNSNVAYGATAGIVKPVAEDGDDAEDSSPEENSSPEQQQEPMDGKGSSPSDRIDLKRSRRRTISATRTSPAIPLHLTSVRRSRMSEDPLGQLDAEVPQEPTVSPFKSSPSVSSTKQPFRSSSSNEADSLLQQYDLEAQTYLLRSQYCRSEVQFLLTLENISNRLLIIPKLARVSALRAELTALNHMLPAEVCMPLWCTSSDSPLQNPNTTEPHHKIVRIPPGESVVLNSAERAPYLLLIEVINGDLDFEPSKRSNKEILRNIILSERERKGGSKNLITFWTSTRPRNSGSQPAQDSVGDQNALGDDGVEALTAHVLPPTPQSPTVELRDEEIDLVEQLYGTGLSLRSHAADLSESIFLPPAPKNKELDAKAWSRSSSIPPSPAIEHSPRMPSPSPLSQSGNNKSLPPTPLMTESVSTGSSILSLDDYSERMRTAAIMLAQLNANLVKEPITPVIQPTFPSDTSEQSAGLSWRLRGSDLNEHPREKGNITTKGPIHPSLAGNQVNNNTSSGTAPQMRMKLQHAEAAAIRERIMKEMMSLEEERMERMRESREGEGPTMRLGDVSGGMRSAEDESIIRKELNKADPSAIVFSESWTAKKARIRHGSPYGHLANWDCVSVIVKTGGDLRQEQLAVQLIREFERIWKEENVECWVRFFRILITGGSSGLVETITDAVSIHSIKKAEYARRLAKGRLGHVTLLDHFKTTYGDPSSAKFARAQRNFAKSLAGYSVVTFLLQIKDRHNGNILLDREGHLIHIDFGFMLSNSPGNIGFEAAPFKLPPEYIELLGGIESEPFLEFKRLFRGGFEAARKHCDRIITLVELMQKDSSLPCFATFGEQTANQLRDRFMPALTHSLVGEYVEQLINSSLGSNWTRLYDSYQYYSQSIL